MGLDARGTRTTASADRRRRGERIPTADKGGDHQGPRGRRRRPGASRAARERPSYQREPAAGRITGRRLRTAGQRPSASRHHPERAGDRRAGGQVEPGRGEQAEDADGGAERPADASRGRSAPRGRGRPGRARSGTRRRAGPRPPGPSWSRPRRRTRRRGSPRPDAPAGAEGGLGIERDEEERPPAPPVEGADRRVEGADLATSATPTPARCRPACSAGARRREAPGRRPARPPRPRPRRRRRSPPPARRGAPGCASAPGRARPAASRRARSRTTGPSPRGKPRRKATVAPSAAIWASAMSTKTTSRAMTWRPRYAWMPVSTRHRRKGAHISASRSLVIAVSAARAARVLTLCSKRST